MTEKKNEKAIGWYLILLILNASSVERWATYNIARL
jgi:hypothetical protein